jgi:Protein of unknown function (DUF4232)
MRFRTSIAVLVAAGFTVAVGSSAAAAASSAEAAGSTSTCQTAHLRYAFGARSGSSSQRTQQVVLTNKGPSACTLSGFPGVDLVGAAHGQRNYRWPLERQVVRYSKVTLKSGGRAHFDLIYLPAAAGDSTDIAVDKLVITPPDDVTHAELTWHQSVLLQDGATHPGTYISPVLPGA